MIEQKSVVRESRGPPKDFLKIKGVKIPTVEEREEEKGAAFYKMVVYLNQGSPVEVERRYSQFNDMKAKLGGTLEVVDAPFPGKTILKVKGAALDKRREDLEIWLNTVIKKLATTRSYAGVQLDSKQQVYFIEKKDHLTKGFGEKMLFRHTV